MHNLNSFKGLYIFLMFYLLINFGLTLNNILLRLFDYQLFETCTFNILFPHKYSENHH